MIAALYDSLPAVVDYSAI